MPIGPTAKMKRLQARWLNQHRRVWTETASVDVDPNTGRPVVTETDVWTGPTRPFISSGPCGYRAKAACTVNASSQSSFRPGLAPATSYEEIRVVDCPDDPYITGAEGTIVDVIREPNSVARRASVRMDNSQ